MVKGPNALHKKQLVYTINVGPVNTRQIALRGRKRPRKTKLLLIKKFNELVCSGLVSDLKFDSEGRLVDIKTWARNPTKEELKIIRGVIVLTQEHLGRRERFSDDVHKKWRRFINEHTKRGQFDFLHPHIEMEIMKGRDPQRLISISEAKSRVDASLLREMAARINTPRKVERNLKIQLKYFEQLLKSKKMKEMTLFEERSVLDRATAKVKLINGKVVRETRSEVLKSGTIFVTTATLHPNGKIVWNEVMVEK